jgi:hypothetical protein
MNNSRLRPHKFGRGTAHATELSSWFGLVFTVAGALNRGIKAVPDLQAGQVALTEQRNLSVARFTGEIEMARPRTNDAGVGGSNPLAPTSSKKSHYEVAFFVPVTKVPASRVSLMLMEQAGILTPQESEEISQLLAG